MNENEEYSFDIILFGSYYIGKTYLLIDLLIIFLVAILVIKIIVNSNLKILILEIKK